MKIIALILSVVLIVFYVPDDSLWLRFFVIAIISILLINLSFRRVVFFKSYFISKYNFLTSKEKFHKVFDLPKELLIIKISEILTSQNYQIIEEDKELGTLFAISTINYKTFGENIYVDFKDAEEGTEMLFYSVSIFGMYSYGKNKQNYENILVAFENSLTI